MVNRGVSIPFGTIEGMVTREELLARLKGYEVVNARHLEEVRAMTPGQKLDQIARLMEAASLFDMSRRDADDQRVIELWQRLRERWPAGK